MYDELYAAWRREIDDPSLGGLPQDFYAKIAEYLKCINEDHSQEQKTVKIALLEHESRNVHRMLGELLDIRYRKIIKTVTRLHKVPIELLASEEAKMCQTFVGFANAYEQFAKNLMEGQQTPITVTIVQPNPAASATIAETPKVEPKPPVVHVTHKRLTLRFTKAIPAIMGADMKSYGPFAAEDVASLPALNAQILIKQGLAVLVDAAA